MVQTMAKTRQGVSSMACWLCILLCITGVFGNYVIEVNIKSYDNPTNKCSTCSDTEFDAVGCCDNFDVTTACTGDLRCDNRFSYCLRSLNTLATSGDCQEYPNTLTSQINTDGELIDFSQPTVLGLPNPLRLPGLTNSWEGTQLYIHISDIDEDNMLSHEFVDSFAINIDRNSQVGALILQNNILSTFRWATMSLTVKVLCAEHYYGERCEKLNECTSSQVTCSEQGNCMDGDGTYTCECEPGYTGSDCEIDIDECLSMIPQCSGHGTCTDAINDFTCSCNDGYTGKVCEKEIDECLLMEEVCSGHGTCTDGINSFTCSCSLGFTGVLCETNIDNCTGVNCSGHGQCVDGVNNFTCLCQPGFTGELCGMAVQEQNKGLDLSVGAITGGVIGAVVTVVIILLLLILIVTVTVKRLGRRLETQDESDDIDLKENIVYGVKPTTVTVRPITSEVNFGLQPNIVYGISERGQRGEDEGSRTRHETKPKDMDFSMDSNIGYGIVPEATLNRQQNMSTEQSTEDMYDYVDTNI